MYKKIIKDLVNEVRNPINTKDFLLRDLFYVANKFTITSAFRTLIPRYTSGLYAFVEEGNFEEYDTDFIIRYLGRADDIQKRLLQHEKLINNVLEKIRVGVTEKTKYFQFAEKILSNPKSYAVYIWRWKNPRAIHKLVFNGEKIGLRDAEGIIGGLIGEVFGNNCFNKEFVSRSVFALNQPNINFMRTNTETKSEVKKSNIDIWLDWCKTNITKDETSLFIINEETKEVQSEINKNGIRLVFRHKDMEKLVSDEVSKINASYSNNKNNFEYDGLIYIMYIYKKYLDKNNINQNLILESLADNDIVPLYFGKTETIGVNGGYSANIEIVHKKKNRGRFALWGDYSSYHIGDLSDALFDNKKAVNLLKYTKWAKFLFEMRRMQSDEPVILNFPVYFWCKAWHKDDKGLILELPCSVYFLERQLIALTNILFPNIILNSK